MKRRYLSAPLPLDASLWCGLTIPPSHQLSQAIDLRLVVHIYSHVDSIAIAPCRPIERASMESVGAGASGGIRRGIGIGREGEAVERAGEEEGEHYEREGADLVGPGAQRHGRVGVMLSHLISLPLSGSSRRLEGVLLVLVLHALPDSVDD